MKKNLLTVLILALLIVNIVLTSVLMFSVMATNKKTAELVTNIATVMNLELTVPGEEPEVVISLEDTEIYSLGSSMTIPLASEEEGAKQKYIMFEISLSMNTEHDDYKEYGETMDAKKSLIKDAITSAVSIHTEAECRNDIEAVKADILAELQKLFQSDFIYKVAISEIKFG